MGAIVTLSTLQAAGHPAVEHASPSLWIVVPAWLAIYLLPKLALYLAKRNRDRS